MFAEKIDSWSNEFAVDADGFFSSLAAFAGQLFKVSRQCRNGGQGGRNPGQVRLPSERAGANHRGNGGHRGSPRAPAGAEIAARKPTTNRFAGIVPNDTVGGGVLQAPAFAPELRDATGNFLEQIGDTSLDQLKEEIPKELMPAFVDGR